MAKLLEANPHLTCIELFSTFRVEGRNEGEKETRLRVLPNPRSQDLVHG